MVEVRVTSVKYEYARALAGPSRVTRAQVGYLLASRDKAVRMTRVQFQAFFADRTKPVRVTRFQVQLFQAVSQLQDPVDPTKAVVIPNRESNPYKPTLPSEVEAVDPILYDYLRDQAETVRKQHDTTQAGDSTFGWEWLTKIGPQQLYTLGSLGRFYHDSYGIILARYCKFTQWTASDFVCCPVGRLAADEAVSWTVTNDFTLSGPDKVLGILGSRTAPNEGEYGWVLTQGANHFAIQIPDGTAGIEKGTALVWSGTGRISGGGKGLVLGRAYAPSHYVLERQSQMDAGTVYLAAEGPSIDSIKALLPDYSDLPGRIKELESTVTGGLVGGIKKAIDELTETVERLDDREALTSEGLTSRIVELEEAIAKLMKASGGDQLEELYLRIIAEVERLDEIQDRAVEKAANLAQDALTIARKLEGADYQRQIDALRAGLGQVPANTSLIPLVTGKIPPEFVYQPDGSLVFVRIES